MEFPLEAGIYGGRLESSLLTPRIREYVERTQARPAYQRALKKAPGYVYGMLCILRIDTRPKPEFHPVPVIVPKEKL